MKKTGPFFSKYVSLKKYLWRIRNKKREKEERGRENDLREHGIVQRIEVVLLLLEIVHIGVTLDVQILQKKVRQYFGNLFLQVNIYLSSKACINHQTFFNCASAALRYFPKKREVDGPPSTHTHTNANTHANNISRKSEGKKAESTISFKFNRRSESY